MSLVGSLKTWA